MVRPGKAQLGPKRSWREWTWEALPFRAPDHPALPPPGPTAAKLSLFQAFHLIKAVSVLLNFSQEEENMLKETLEYKVGLRGLIENWSYSPVLGQPRAPLRMHLIPAHTAPPRPANGCGAVPDTVTDASDIHSPRSGLASRL